MSKRVSKYCLSFILLVALLGQIVLNDYAFPVDSIGEVDSTQLTVSSKHHSTSNNQVIAEYEIEEELEDQNDQHYGYLDYNPAVIFFSSCNRIAFRSIFHVKKIVKLYVLFHSWRSSLI